MNNTPEQAAMLAATNAVRQIIAQSKNPRTLLGQTTPSHVAFQAAWAAVTTYNETLEAEQRAQSARDGTHVIQKKPIFYYSPGPGWRLW